MLNSLGADRQIRDHLKEGAEKNKTLGVLSGKMLTTLYRVITIERKDALASVRAMKLLFISLARQGSPGPGSARQDRPLKRGSGDPLEQK
jgi:hypothetical protein